MTVPKLSIPPTTQPSGNLLHHKRSAGSQHDQLIHHTQRLVSQTFFGTMLKQMRDSPFKSEMFSGGRGGQMFSQLLDQHLADRMARGSGKKLVNAIVRHIEGSRNGRAAKHVPSGINPSVKSAYSSPQKASSNVPAGLRA
jgi:Rod binding domain-containing protein